MSTALTKVIETAKGFNLWTKTWWMRVPEPRDISFLFSLAYLVTLYMGVMAFLAPPQSVKGVTGPVIMGTIGVFLIAGSLLGMWSGAKDLAYGGRGIRLWLERALLARHHSRAAPPSTRGCHPGTAVVHTEVSSDPNFHSSSPGVTHHGHP